MTVERWRDHAAFDRRLTTPHMQMRLRAIVPMLAAPPENSRDARGVSGNAHTSRGNHGVIATA
jgi:quinol monooxygenase YgiN